MDILLNKVNGIGNATIFLNASKSESNRVLVLNALSPASGKILNLSNARDTETMERLLSQPESDTWDVLDAGTTMRFLTAFTAIGNRARTLTGTERMQQRPIRLLADALVQLGANVNYLKEEGYPPHTIHPVTEQQTDLLEIPGNISSQYISALLMIAPTLPQGLKLKITGQIFSLPYIKMTLNLMKRYGVSHTWEDQTISITSQTYQPQTYTVESDWSGASYWYSIAALAPACDLFLKGLRKESNQGDQAIAEIMDDFGVETQYEDDGVRLTKKAVGARTLQLDFRHCPDLAQTVVACAAVTGFHLQMTGLESLKIKETDRIAALQAEIAKFGAELTEHSDGKRWTMIPGEKNLTDRVTIATYEDHRMAMAFAPLALKFDLLIEDLEVVNKSYPDFWKDLATVGIKGEVV